MSQSWSKLKPTSIKNEDQGIACRGEQSSQERPRPERPFPAGIATSSHLAHFPFAASCTPGVLPGVPDEAIYREAFRFSLAFIRCPSSNVASKRRLLDWLARLV